MAKERSPYFTKNLHPENKTGAVMLYGGMGGVAAGAYGVAKRKINRKIANDPEYARRHAARVLPQDVVRNSSTRGIKTVITPQSSVSQSPRAARPVVIKTDSPFASVNRASGGGLMPRSIMRDVLHAPATVMYGAKVAVGPPSPKTFPNARANVAVKPVALVPNEKRKVNYRGKHIVSSGSYPQNLGTRTSSGAAYNPYGGLSAVDKGLLRRQTNKAAAAAKPLYQRGLSIRYGEAPTPPKPKTPRKPRGKKAPAATTIEVPSAPTETKPKTTRKPRTPKAPEPVTVEVTPKEQFKRAVIPEVSQQGSNEWGSKRQPGETRKEASARRKAAYAAEQAAKRAAKKGEPKNTMKAPTSAKPPSPDPATPERIAAPTNKPRLTAEERRAAKAAKSAENKRIHAENQAREREARMAAKAAAGNATTPVVRPKPNPSGFVSNYIPKTREFDPMTAKPGGGLRALSGEAMRHSMAVRTDRRMYGKGGPNTGPLKITPIENATSTMFPGTPDRPVTGQPHMQGRGAKVIGEQGNFRVWQGNRRSEIVVQHRTGRQVNLPHNDRQGPVNVKGILDYVNRKDKGDNEKAFLKGGWTADGRTVAGKVGTRNRIARFTIGAAKAGGILSLPIAAATVLAGSDPLEAAGFQVDTAGGGSNPSWYAKSHPKRWASEQRATKKYVAAYNARRAGSQFKGAANWADIAKKYVAGKK